MKQLGASTRGSHWLGVLIGSVLSLLLLVTGAATPALAYDNPDLLPDHPTPVIDLAKILT
ncbi:MAG: TPM domain-containing protein, partial [Vulcanococcus sp.]